MKVMKNFYEEQEGEPIPEIVKKRHSYFSGNSGWGSSMDSYTGMNTKYLDENDRVLFYGYDDRYSTDVAWEVAEIFKNLYNFFGEEAFETFVKLFYKLDITQKGRKPDNWYFYEISIDD